MSMPLRLAQSRALKQMAKQCLGTIHRRGHVRRIYTMAVVGAVVGNVVVAAST